MLSVHLVVRKSLTPTLTKGDLYGDIGDVVLEAVTEAVQILKSSRDRGLTRLKKNLKPPPRTHRKSQRVFKSCLPMLKSVHANFKKVKQALHKLGRDEVLASIVAKDLKDIIGVVEPVETLAKRNANTFHSSHLKKVVAITHNARSDSMLQCSVKSHIRSNLVPILRILALIKKCKDITNFIKNSGSNDRLVGGTLKQEVDTRWMSILIMIRSFFIWPKPSGQGEEPPSKAKVTQINDILSKKDKASLVLSDDETTLMLQIIYVLRPIESAIKVLEASKVPTIHHVIPRFSTLQKHLQPKEADTEDVKVFRACLLKELEQKVAPNISLRHKMGLFFWPKFASLPNLSALEKSEILTEIRRLCNEQRECLARKGLVSVSQPGLSGHSPSKRRRTRRTESDDDDEYDSLVPADHHQHLDEVDKYLLMQDVSVKSNAVLQWWKEKAPMFPTLSRVARMILGTSAASASVKRVFSHAGNLISPKKTCLAAETVDNYLFLNDFVRKFGLAVLMLIDE